MFFLLLTILFGIIPVLVCIKYFTLPKVKSIKNKHVVITGGSSGIGKSVAVEAAKQGAHVTIIAQDPIKLEAAKQEIQNSCINPEVQKVQALSLDVTQSTNVENLMKIIDDELPVFMLVNCAGMAICGTLEQLSTDDINKLINLNFLGSVYITKYFIPRMKIRNEGIIVLTSSQAGLVGIYGLGVYSASKFALRGLAEALAMELRSYNISVTVSLPPDTDTPGLLKENESKPKETSLISETGGLFHPDVVGKQLIDDALVGKFFSTNGFESFMLTTLCCGMSPFVSFAEVIIQAALLGPFRLISSVFILKFQNIIEKCKKELK